MKLLVGDLSTGYINISDHVTGFYSSISVTKLMKQPSHGPTKESGVKSLQI